MESVKNMLLVLLALAVAILALRSPSSSTQSALFSEVSRTSDTLSVVRVDTTAILEPYLVEISRLNELVEVRVRVIDSLHHVAGLVDTIYSERVVYIEREQRHYANEGSYDLWVSGVEPLLDSIKVYNRVEQHRVTNTITTATRECALYGSLSMMNVGSNCYPMVGLMFASRGRFAYGASVALCGAESIYGFTLSYRLWGR